MDSHRYLGEANQLSAGAVALVDLTDSLRKSGVSAKVCSALYAAAAELFTAVNELRQEGGRLRFLEQAKKVRELQVPVCSHAGDAAPDGGGKAVIPALDSS